MGGICMNRLCIVWKSDNPIDIHNFIIPYAYNAKVQEWFDDVHVIIWGASQEIVKEAPLIQERIKNLLKNNIHVYACMMCARNVEATAVLQSIGVDVQYTGDLLSEYLKDSDTEVLTI
jgi:hypothetical protein